MKKNKIFAIIGGIGVLFLFSSLTNEIKTGDFILDYTGTIIATILIATSALYYFFQGYKKQLSPQQEK